MKKLITTNYYLLLILVVACGPGCVGNKAETEVTGLKIERKPSAAEEAQGWANAIKTIWSKDNGSD